MESRTPLSTTPIYEQNDQTRARQLHLEQIGQIVGNAYPNKFQRSNVAGTPEGEDTITAILERFKQKEPVIAAGEKPSPEALESANAELNPITVRLSGRIGTTPRVLGK